MSQDQLGLFDTPPSRQQIRFSSAIVGLLFTALVILLALPDVRLRQIDAFIPMVDAILFLGDLITATLLYLQASVFRSRALTVLASGYTFTALMIIAHVLTFPGAFAPGGLLGAKINTTAWIVDLWRAAPPIALILYVLLRRADSVAQTETERPARIGAGLFAGIVIAVALVLLTTLGHDLLPQLFLNRVEANYANAFRVNCVLIALIVIALTALFSNCKSVLDMWLLIGTSGWLAHALLNLATEARFTVYFYGQFSLLLFSHLVVMLALIGETSRLYMRLAISTTARNRERDARLITLDAVTAAICHEVGQPLAAANLNAAAGLHMLDRSSPNLEKLGEALRQTIDAVDRTSAVIKSIRAAFRKEPGAAAEFSLDDLVRKTAGLFDRELAAKRISLRLALDETLPPIPADRVQIQRVLINLFTNAIESLGATQGRPRNIVVRSGSLNGEDVLLEVSDNGIGIAPDQMERIFEHFFTTKASGTGLGLAISRFIAEEHGGRLWASSGRGHGATFHLELPRSKLSVA